jgi:hypothetical protein
LKSQFHTVSYTYFHNPIFCWLSVAVVWQCFFDVRYPPCQIVDYETFCLRTASTAHHGFLGDFIVLYKLFLRIPTALSICLRLSCSFIESASQFACIILSSRHLMQMLRVFRPNLCMIKRTFALSSVWRYLLEAFINCCTIPPVVNDCTSPDDPDLRQGSVWSVLDGSRPGSVRSGLVHPRMCAIVACCCPQQ